MRGMFVLAVLTLGAGTVGAVVRCLTEFIVN